MINFEIFSKAVHDKLASFTHRKLFQSALTHPAQRYLAAFPEGTDPLYITNSYHDCTCCKHFVANLGSVVVINDDLTLDSIWNVPNLPYPYDVVAAAMHKQVTKAGIRAPYYTPEASYGAQTSRQHLQGGTAKTWHHFYGNVPQFSTRRDLKESGEQIMAAKTLRRALEELTTSAVATVVELIEGNAIYRGVEYAKVVKSFQSLQADYRNLATTTNELAYNLIWKNCTSNVASLRNTAIGSLLVDLSDGRDLESAVAAYEAKVAPENYKRTTGLITPAMVQLAVAKITELGIEPQLHRRLANKQDLKVSNLLWVNRQTANLQSGLEQTLMKLAKAPTMKTKPKGDEISMADFVSSVLPQASKVRVLFAPEHVQNLVTLTCAQDRSEPPTLFKWNNDFAWAYRGGLTDSSIKRLVKAAGGATDAALRISLAWHNADDLDLFVRNPRGETVYHGARRNGGGVLDVDAHRMGYQRKSADQVLTPVENVVYRNLVDGTYLVTVTQYKRMETRDQGFTVEVEIGGTVMHFTSEKSCHMTDMLGITVKDGQLVSVTAASGVKESTLNQEAWNLKTGTFVDVTSVMRSPNFWDGEVGNEHLFFTLEGCKVSERVHGLFNEFLRPELAEHRKVFEHLGDTCKCDPVDDQLSGIGFSMTKAAKVTFEVTSEGGKKLYDVVV
jgi:hypothetical protein